MFVTVLQEKYTFFFKFIYVDRGLYMFTCIYTEVFQKARNQNLTSSSWEVSYFLSYLPNADVMNDCKEHEVLKHFSQLQY